MSSQVTDLEVLFSNTLTPKTCKMLCKLCGSCIVLHDRHQHVDAHRDPNLSFDCVDRVSVEALDPQMLLDPFEEQFHLPTHLVELANS